MHSRDCGEAADIFSEWRFWDKRSGQFHSLSVWVCKTRKRNANQQSKSLRLQNKRRAVTLDNLTHDTGGRTSSILGFRYQPVCFVGAYANEQTS